MGKEISSGELKARLELDFDVSEYIDGRIESYIKEKGLYRNYADIINKLKGFNKPRIVRALRPHGGFRRKVLHAR